MCGRLTLTPPNLSALAASLGAVVQEEFEYTPRFNVAPTQRHPIVRAEGADRVLEQGVWGFSSRGGKLLINARSETASRLPSFREAFRSRRCLVPADGFYEWKGPPKDRRPIWFHAPERRLLLFAGLYEEGRDLPLPRFTVLTCDANRIVAPVHQRMPVILGHEEAWRWLEEGPSELLVAAGEDLLVGVEVSKKVNDVRFDEPACIQKEEARQLSFFDV